MHALCIDGCSVRQHVWKGRVRAGVHGAYPLRCCIVRVAVLARTRWVHDAYDSLFHRVHVGFMKRTSGCCGTYALKMKHVRGAYAQTYVLNVALMPIRVNLVVSMPPPPPCCLSLGFFFPYSRNMPPLKEYQQLGRTTTWERMAELQTAVKEILGPTWQVQAGENVNTLILKTTDGPMPQNQMWHAEALLWDCRKGGKRWRAQQYSIPTSRIKHSKHKMLEVPLV